jgi:hypothetical protein
MEQRGMFKRKDFEVPTFEQLALFTFTVLSCTWCDSKWSDLVGVSESPQSTHSGSGLSKVLPDTTVTQFTGYLKRHEMMMMMFIGTETLVTPLALKL